MTIERRRNPLIAAGILMGAGLGGFLDGIILHQILQWHHMLSSKLPANDLISLKVNMYWDGLFHAAVWVMTAIGLFLLWRVGQRKDVPWSGRTFLGALSCGWGSFNIVEGIIDHQVLGIHHVYEFTADKVPWDMSFLAFGVIMVLIGWVLVRLGSSDIALRGEAS